MQCKTETFWSYRNGLDGENTTYVQEAKHDNDHSRNLILRLSQQTYTQWSLQAGLALGVLKNEFVPEAEIKIVNL